MIDNTRMTHRTIGESPERITYFITTTKHEDKDKAEKERKIISNGHFPDQDLPSKNPGSKHSKKDEDEEGEKNE